MDHLLNDAPPEDASDEVIVKNEAPTVVSPSSSAASLGLHMLSVSAAAPALGARPAAPPRLPPISLLTAAAAALQPMQCQPLYTQAPPQPQLRPVIAQPLPIPAASPPASNAALPADDMLCRYRNKKCGYPRAIKRNGERHNLCERHRAKANQNQRKLESKRRTQKRMKQRAHSLTADRIVKAKKAASSAETEIKFTLYGGAIA
ncbi:hypothetical protein F443_04552 [Phytophthora nicotianae P1569]|uniref:Uncharacterized protein n=2 Tax=Phytophthora nicotianae TaxID=4792 RepID=V9FL99_PHYNI|nr:hypothetical protein F443_04552 [Phytophthora nicotianae P1569]ETO81027.1 hypothetical protein F444_04582 [Phytophthora nicotianae P1976]